MTTALLKRLPGPFTTLLCRSGRTVACATWLSLASVLAGESRVESTTCAPSACLSPTALAATEDGKVLFIACASANQVAVFDTASDRVVYRLDVPESPSGLALAKDGARLYVACAAPSSVLCVVDVALRRIAKRIPAGHTAMAPVLSPDEKTLYVCNRFNDSVSVIDLATGTELKRIPVEREPVAAAMTPDGRYLVVANHLHGGTANQEIVGARLSIIDTRTGELSRNIPLLEGASLLRGIAISPDGRFAAVTHLRSMYWRATTAVEFGAMNGNALTVLDMKRLRVLGVLLLDQTARGGANPWAVTWTPDGRTIAVSHAGTHEVSLVDAPVEADPASFLSFRLSNYSYGPADPSPPKHLVRVRKRLLLPGEGPRALAVAGNLLYVVNYFSDNLCRIDLAKSRSEPELLSLGPAREPSLVRKGEMAFNDARLCRQTWQSCASCHDADARSDALNWDLLNDGIGNPKNTRSLVWSHRIGPVMALGVRTNAETAVRAGIHHILFTEQPEEVPAAIDAWLMSLQPLPSPHLANGCLSPAAQRGRLLFLSPQTGCSRCHPPPLFTDSAGHDVGTSGQGLQALGEAGVLRPPERFYSPALVELWRTAPYLHDGSVATLRELLTGNANDRHGSTSRLTPQQIDDLVQYLLSL